MPRMNFSDTLARIEARYSRGVLLLLQKFFEPATVAAYFAHSPLLRRTEKRAVWLHRSLIERFGPAAGTCLLERYLTARPKPQHFRALFCRDDEFRPPEHEVAALVPRIVSAPHFGRSALVGLTAALLERGLAPLAISAILDHHRRLSSEGRLDTDWWDVVRPLLVWPANTATPSADRTLTVSDLVPGPAEHRLIVMDEPLSPAMIRHLATGAGKVTLLRFNELYGKLPLAEVQEALPDVEVTVEHARTRVGRFSSRYAELHERTRDLARILIDPLSNGLGEGRAADKRLNAILVLADRLFFKALRIDGCLRAIRDTAFDSVVVSASRNGDLVRLVLTDPASREGARVTFGCWSTNHRTLVAFPRQFAAARQSSADDAFAATEIEPEARERHFSLVRSFVDRPFSLQAVVEGAPREHASRIAVTTSGNRAYLSSSVQAALALGRSHDVDLIWTHGRLDALQDALEAAQKNGLLASEGGIRVPRILALNKDPTSRRVQRVLSRLLRVQVAEDRAPIEAVLGEDIALRAMFDSEMRSDLPDFLMRLFVQFGRAERLLAEEDYAAVLVCPVREPRNAVYVSAARKAGIPSLTFEPHCLNSAYCRYSSVLTDFAALYNDYFVREYAENFSLSADRSFIVGSPRILRPPAYDPKWSRRERRAELGIPADLPVVVLATQPMPAIHTETVFRDVVRAVVSLGRPVRLYVKPHPEENEADRALYRTIIRQESGTATCSVVDIDVKDLMIASDLVVVYYSVTALEAAVLERNVLIAGRRGEPYPMAYDEILSVPLCTDADEIRAAMLDTFASGPAATTGIGAFRDRHPYLYDNRVFDRLADAVQSVIESGETGIRDAATFPDQPFVTAEFREYLG